jgi:HEAT repeats
MMKLRKAFIILITAAGVLILFCSPAGTRLKAGYLIWRYQSMPKRDPAAEGLRLASLGRDAGPVLLARILQPHRPYVDVGIALALIKNQDERLIDRLTELLGSADPETRGSAIHVITAPSFYYGYTAEEERMFDTPNMRAKLTMISQSDPVPHLRSAAVQALSEIDQLRAGRQVK